MPLGAFKAALMGTAGVSAGADVVLLSTTTASNASAVSITSGIDSTYGEYIFRFYNINPATDGAQFTFQGSIDAGSNYNVTLTSTVFDAHHDEADSSASLVNRPNNDQAQGTAFQQLVRDCGNGADESCAGVLHLFNPGSTTYVTQFLSRFNSYNSGNQSVDMYVSGYFNNTNDIDAVQFKMHDGNFDGKIKMWGVK